jgi:hypothetical protein
MSVSIRRAKATTANAHAVAASKTLFTADLKLADKAMNSSKMLGQKREPTARASRGRQRL